MTERLIYFAYGSNMYTPRLRFRVEGFAPLGVAVLGGHQMRFHKQGKDGSAKCDAFRTDVAADRVVGVIYEIAPSAKETLDRHEGLGRGYNDAAVEVVTFAGERIRATTYVAAERAIDPTLRPFSWYKDFVVMGAREHGLPADYVDAFIHGVEAKPDPDLSRENNSRNQVLFEALSGGRR